MPSCPNCGTEARAEARFCSRCGSNLGSTLIRQQSSSTSDVTIAGKLRSFAILLIAGSVVQVPNTILSRVTTVPFWAGTGFFVVWAGTLVAGLFVLFSAFRALAQVDSASFANLDRYFRYLIAGLVMVVIVGLVPSGTFDQFTLVIRFIGSILFDLITVAGALMTLAGGIITVLGLWRMGKRYSNSGLKLAAFLFWIPYLNIVPAALILRSTQTTAGLAQHLTPARVRPPISLIPYAFVSFFAFGAIVLGIQELLNPAAYATNTLVSVQFVRQFGIGALVVGVVLFASTLLAYMYNSTKAQ